MTNLPADYFDWDLAGPAPEPERRSWVPRLMILLVVVIVAFAVATANSAFGRNIHGTVTCQNGPVVGIWVEPESPLSRPPGKDGFATWYSTTPGGSTATFDYWEIVGSSTSIHVGCGKNAAGGWATDNWSPTTSASNVKVVCNNPQADLNVPITLTVKNDCTVTHSAAASTPNRVGAARALNLALIQ